jgi:hypothetical protein
MLIFASISKNLSKLTSFDDTIPDKAPLETDVLRMSGLIPLELALGMNTIIRQTLSG